MVPDPTALEGSLLVQAKERNGAFIMQWLPLVLAPVVVPPPPTIFLELFPTLDKWERDLFDHCQVWVPYHQATQLLCIDLFYLPVTELRQSPRCHLAGF